MIPLETLGEDSETTIYILPYTVSFSYNAKQSCGRMKDLLGSFGCWLDYITFSITSSNSKPNSSSFSPQNTITDTDPTFNTFNT
ncbi:hypothetical protein D9758_017875 [Tetrapyrgos nigripes]|uniref:Uncharacterized protein n=1 Tax=Tetrapyrgos nigripes TaxID=182062 RepID=A0A8H5BBC5_9AGAR|nr:hypothetical protein D9758_017875 [Tetrapyrgos nigripes]